LVGASIEKEVNKKSIPDIKSQRNFIDGLLSC